MVDFLPTRLQKDRQNEPELMDIQRIKRFDHLALLDNIEIVAYQQIELN